MANYIALKLTEKGLIDISFIHDINDETYLYIRGIYEKPPYRFLEEKPSDCFISREALFKPFRTSEWKLRPGLGEILLQKEVNIIYYGEMVYFHECLG